MRCVLNRLQGFAKTSLDHIILLNLLISTSTTNDYENNMSTCNVGINGFGRIGAYNNIPKNVP